MAKPTNGTTDAKLEAMVREWFPIRAERDKLQAALETLAEKETMIAERIHKHNGNEPFDVNGTLYRATERDPIRDGKKRSETDGEYTPTYSVRALPKPEAKASFKL